MRVVYLLIMGILAGTICTVFILTSSLILAGGPSRNIPPVKSAVTSRLQPPPEEQKIKTRVVPSTNTISHENERTFALLFKLATPGTLYAYSIDDGSKKTQPVTGNGSIAFRNDKTNPIDVSALNDGSLYIKTVLTNEDGSRAELPALKVRKDSSGPKIKSFSIDNGNYFGHYLDVRFTFDERLIVTGTPQVALDLGKQRVNATYNPEKSEDKELIFSYKTSARDIDTDGIQVRGPIELNKGKIVDIANNRASLQFKDRLFKKAVSVGKNCLEYKQVGANANGIYEIRPGDKEDAPAMSAYCDMTTNGGGWTLVLNYLHQGSTRPDTRVRRKELPLENATVLGENEANSIFWGHASNELLNEFDFQEMRFYCRTSNTRVEGLHFYISHKGSIKYAKTGKGSMQGLDKKFIPLRGQAETTIPETNKFTESNQGENALLNAPFAVGRSATWKIGIDDEWECNDNSATYHYDTHHQVWIR